jgi:hypothetical protein
MNFQITTNSQNWKIFRVWSEAPAINPINLYVASSNGRVFVENAGDPDPGFWADGRILALPANTWTVEEFIFQASTGTATNGSLSILHNGAVKAAGTIRTRTASSDPLELMYPVHHVSANVGTWNPVPPGGDGIIGWADDVYVDTSWQRVMVCAQSTWAACANKSIQIPSAWSDTAISVTLNKGLLSGLVGSYLYVIDADGGVNAQGFPLCTSDCPPNPPLNLRIQ